jgi:hypothetical protein
MKRYLVIAGVAGSVMIAACKDAAAPGRDQPYVATISQIHVPSQVGLWDTVRVDFTYFTPGCDSSVVVIRLGYTQLKFTARGYPTDRICINDLGGIHMFRYNVYPPQDAPLSIIFTEPNGGDSVRTVTPSEVP